MFLEMMEKTHKSCVAKVTSCCNKKNYPPNRVSSVDDHDDRLLKGTKPKKKKRLVD